MYYSIIVNNVILKCIFNLHIQFYTIILICKASGCTWQEIATHWLRATGMQKVSVDPLRPTLGTYVVFPA
jgi:hypothetical protein